ncbi:hypothetical protein HID58_057323 [Brassica napus]|uniref:Uncharacterized protein n=1 Tax=Brassica napus TaxID=3708 RepID=A0ABQ8AQR6_BRANA|nr:hypothetical protein HID58_057323 [Brassica napus]
MEPPEDGKSQFYLYELKAGRCRQSVDRRLFRFWKARNVKKGGENILKQGRLYDLSGFDVTKTNQSFCLSDSPVSICFTDQAKFHELPENKGLIPMELFRFQDYDNSVLLANTNTDLPVVIHGVEPQVIAATNVNSKLVGGRLFPNLASVTLLYFAGECEANTSCVKGGQEVCIDYLGTEFICPQLPSAEVQAEDLP